MRVAMDQYQSQGRIKPPTAQSRAKLKGVMPAQQALDRSSHPLRRSVKHNSGQNDLVQRIPRTQVQEVTVDASVDLWANCEVETAATKLRITGAHQRTRPTVSFAFPFVPMAPHVHAQSLKSPVV